jgi:hypothetical protein
LAELRTSHFAPVEGLIARERFDAPSDFGPRRAVREVRRAERPRLVSSSQGEIGQMLLAFPDYTTLEPLASLFPNLLDSLRSGLSTGSSLIVLAHRSNAGIAEQWLDRAGFADRRVVAVDDSVHFSVWAEDAFVGVVDDAAPERVILVEPPAFGRYADGLLADYLEEAGLDVATYQVPLYFQGGNVLVGDDFFLIGLDYPLKTLEGLFRPAGGDALAEVREEYRRHLDGQRDLEFVGTSAPIRVPPPRPFVAPDGKPGIEVFGGAPGTFQPIFHIDMFVTPAGRDPDGRFRVLVGDPRAAAELLGEELPEHASAGAFDEIAERLSAAGLRVIRNPLPYTFHDRWSDRERRWVRTWYHATSNNALVEVGAASRQVWIPTYGYGPWEALERTDQANARLWADLGFTVRSLGDFHPLAQASGAVHCVKKYLRRGP